MLGDAPSKAHWSSVGIFWILLAGALVIAQSIIIPLVLAILVTLVFNPIRRALNHIGISSGVAAFIFVFCSILVFSIIGASVYSTLYSRAGDIETLVPDAIAKLEQLTGLIQPVIEASEQIDSLVPENDADEVVVQTSSFFSLVAQSTPTMLGMIVLNVTLVFFLLASGDMFYEKLVLVMPTVRDKARALAIAHSIEKHLSCYLLTITIINAGLGLCVGLAMWAMGMPNPTLFGVMAFLLNFIPYLGAMAGVALTFFVGLLSFDAVLAAAIPALVYFMLTSLEGQFITPIMVGRRLKLNAVVVFLSLAVWAWLWSIPGMFLSTPILIVLKAFSDRLPELSAINSFIAERDNISRKDGLILKRFIPYEEDLVAGKS